MEKLDQNKLSGWVDARMETLAAPSDWTPDSEQALARLLVRVRSQAPRRTWLWAAAAAAACVAILALPAPRALAQRLWDSLFLNRIEVVRFDVNEEAARVLRAETVGTTQPTSVNSAEEASRVTGFAPRLPGTHILGAAPKLYVAGPIVGRLRLSKKELENALAAANATDVHVPLEWEAVTIEARVSPIIIAEYPQISIVQFLPLSLNVPSGFEMPRFLEAAFRILRVQPREARYLSERFAANPAWFLPVPPDEHVEVREVRLASGPGMLIEDFSENGTSERVAVVWSTPDRIFAVSGGISHELALSIANSIR